MEKINIQYTLIPRVLGLHENQINALHYVQIKQLLVVAYPIFCEINAHSA